MSLLFSILFVCYLHITKAEDVTLQPNQAYLQSIRANEVAYYTLNITTQSLTSWLHIYMTPIGACNPDLFVSFTVPRPGAGDADTAAHQTQTKFLIIDPSLFALHSQVFVGMLGFTACQYSFVYRFVDGASAPLTPMQALDNIPQLVVIPTSNGDQVHHFAIVSYQLRFNASKSLTNVVSFDLSSLAEHTAFFRLNVWSDRPTAFETNASNALFSYGIYSTQLVITPADDQCIKCTRSASGDNTTCYGRSGSQHVAFQVHDDFLYFVIEVNPNLSDRVDAALTLIINDEPHYGTSSGSSSGSVVACAECGPNGMSPEDQLWLDSDDTKRLSLNREWDTKTVSPLFFQYVYALPHRNVSSCDLQITISDTQGATRLYWSAHQTTAWPSNTTFDLKSESESHHQVITVQNITAGKYHAGVYAAPQSRTDFRVPFTVTTSLECTAKPSTSSSTASSQVVVTQWTTLRMGIPVYSATAMDTYDYFRFTVPVNDSDEHVRISIIPELGDIDMYMTCLHYNASADNTASSSSSMAPPNANTAHWKDTSLDDASTVSKLIDIRGDDPLNCPQYPCTYLITVHCGVDNRGGGGDTAQPSSGCLYTITGSLSLRSTVLQSSQPLNDVLRKSSSGEAHIYSFDYAIDGDTLTAAQGQIIVSVTPVAYFHHDVSTTYDDALHDVDIAVSTVNPFSELADSLGDAIWSVSSSAANLLAVNMTSLLSSSSSSTMNSSASNTFWIRVALSDAYNVDAQQPDLFEYTVMAYDEQSIRLPLKTTLVNAIPAGHSMVFEAAIAAGKNFAVFMAGRGNVTAQLLVSNRVGSVGPPQVDDTTTYEWSSPIGVDGSMLAHVVLNWDNGDDALCQSMKSVQADASLGSQFSSNEPAIAGISDYKCAYWITVHNADAVQSLSFVILSTDQFYELANGETVKAVVTADDPLFYKRFVIDPQTLSLVAERKYNLVVSAAIIVGERLGLTIGSTPFDDNLYSELDGVSHDYAIGRNVSIEKPFYIGVLASPGDMMSVTATFLDVLDASDSQGFSTGVLSYLSPGMTQFSVLDTNVLGATHACHLYQQKGNLTTASETVFISFSSVIGGDDAIILVQHVSNPDATSPSLDCTNTDAYLDIGAYQTQTDPGLAPDTWVMFGARDAIQIPDVARNDFMYVAVYPFADIDAIGEDGYYMEYRMLAFSQSDTVLISNGVPVNLKVSAGQPISGKIPITKKMLALSAGLNATAIATHFLDVSYTKYSDGKPAIYVSSVDHSPNASTAEYSIIENEESRAPVDVSAFNPQKSETFGVTINFRELQWPDGNEPWWFTNDASVVYDDAFDVGNYEYYDDQVEIDDWIGYLYVTVSCIDGDYVDIDLQSNNVRSDMVSSLAYGVPMYSDIQTQGELKYFSLDIGDTDLIFNDARQNDSNVARGILQIGVYVTSGAAEIYVNAGAAFPDPDDAASYTDTTFDAQHSASLINGFKVIDVNLTALAHTASETIVVGVQAKAQLTQFVISAQKLSVSATVLSFNTPHMAQLSPSTPYAIYDIDASDVDLPNSDAHNNETASVDFYITAHAIAGKVALFCNAPDKYPAIPTTAVDADYVSADAQLAFQMVYVSYAELLDDAAQLLNTGTPYMYRCVVGLLDERTSATFNVMVNQQVEGDLSSALVLSSSIPITYVLGAGQQQLFLFSQWQMTTTATPGESGDDLHDLAVILSAVYGNPSMYIGFNGVPNPNRPASYNWSTSQYGVDSQSIHSAPYGTYYILVDAEQSSVQFTLTASSSESEHILTAGVTVVDEAQQGRARSYVFIPTRNADLEDATVSDNVYISILLYTGQVNVYTSLESDASADNMVSSFTVDDADIMRSETHVVPLMVTSPQQDWKFYCNATTFQCTPIHISVVPNITMSAAADLLFANASDDNTSTVHFSIMVTQREAGILSDGVATQSHFVLNREPQTVSYRFTVDTQSSSDSDTVRFTLSSLHENPTVFFTVYPTGTAGNATQSVVKYMYDTSQTIVLQNTCLNSKQNSVNSYTYRDYLCVYLVQVQYADNTTDTTDTSSSSDEQQYRFTMLASTQNAFITLQDGVTITDTISSDDSFKYYNFYADSINTRQGQSFSGQYALEVDVNPTYGDPDLYIARDVPSDKLVNTSYFEWRSMRFGEDNIVILLEDSSFVHCVYQIGVYAYSATQYRLNAWLRPIVTDINETDSSHAITVFSGQSRYDYSNHSVQCYVFNTDYAQHRDEQIEVTVTLHQGIVDIFVDYDSMPMDSLADANSKWDVSVRGYSASLSRYPKIIPVASLADDGVTHIEKIYACVQGTSNQGSLYEISIDYKSGIKSLTINGMPMIGSARYGESDYFNLNAMSTRTDASGIYLNVETIDDDGGLIPAPWVFVSRFNRRPSANDTQCESVDMLNAGLGHCTLAFMSASDDQLRVILLDSRYVDTRAVTYYVAVTPVFEPNTTVNTTRDIHYQIVCSSTVSEIESGTSITDTLIRSTWKYYVYDTSDKAEARADIPIIVTYTLLSGDTRTYVSNSFVLAPDNYDQISAAQSAIDNGTNNHTAIGFSGSHEITLDPKTFYYCNANTRTEADAADATNFLSALDAMFGIRFNPVDITSTSMIGCKYYIAVYAETNSHYRINLHFPDELNELKPIGIPTHGQLSDAGAVYYYVVLTYRTERLQILLTDMDGNIDSDLLMYINVDNDNDASNNADGFDKPNENAEYVVGNGSITFLLPTIGTYYVTVHAAAGNGDHFYSILATTQKIFLLENYPQLISTTYSTLKEIRVDYSAEMTGELSSVGFYFAYNVFKAHEDDDAYSIEFDVHSATNNNDLFTVYVTNSELVPQCDIMANCPNALLCDANRNANVDDDKRCGHLVSRNVDNPVVIEPSSEWYCQYVDNANMCTYFVSVFLDGNYEQQVHDFDMLQFDITARSSAASSGVVLYDGSAVSSGFAKHVDASGNAIVAGASSSTGSSMEYNFYVSYMPETATDVEVTLQTCRGDVDLFVSKQSVFPNKLTAEYQSESEDQVEVVYLPDLQIETAQQTQKVLYIGVRDSRYNDVSVDSMYKLRVGYPVRQFAPIITVHDLSVSSLAPGEATVTFALKFIPNDIDRDIRALLDEHPVTIEEYVLYFAKDAEPFTMYSHCGLHALKQSSQCALQSSTLNTCFVSLGHPLAGSDDSNHFQYTVTGLHKNRTYNFNVLLKLKVENIGGNDNNDKHVFVTYVEQSAQIIDFVSDRATITALEIAFGITIPLIFILVGAVFYYCKKYKRVVRDLSVLEMEEVPINKMVKAVGGVKLSKYEKQESNLKQKTIGKFKNFTSEMKKKKERRAREKAKNYHSLLSSHEDDEVSDDDDLEDSMQLEMEPIDHDDATIEEELDDNEKHVAN